MGLIVEGDSFHVNSSAFVLVCVLFSVYYGYLNVSIVSVVFICQLPNFGLCYGNYIYMWCIFL